MRRVTKRPVCAEGKTFDDIKDHPARAQVEELAQRGIVSGISETEFGPERPITRAEFAAIMVKGLGLALTGAKNVPGRGGRSLVFSLYFHCIQIRNC